MLPRFTNAITAKRTVNPAAIHQSRPDQGAPVFSDSVFFSQDFIPKLFPASIFSLPVIRFDAQRAAFASSSSTLDSGI